MDTYEVRQADREHKREFARMMCLICGFSMLAIMAAGAVFERVTNMPFFRQ